ncbi:hypothetical protein [Iodobacter ciconiae]|uniref:Uncharacterized protein n=1 Tax=Iodobacter ciconiae TaxID=2496266 RepID=A0A3S8ZRV4_9NEIS|nr:hypothetical protein [Iodobacter ciconiae]AZN36233.1 hypothetical protein EJO50_06900 [Iodobacter ciconiae]
MDIQYQEFLSNIAKIELISRQIKKSTEIEYELMVKNHQSLAGNTKERYSNSHHNMFFRSLTSGEAILYDHMSLDFEQRVKDLIKRHNKHSLWLLAEAFEYFEDLVELMYAHIGHNEPSVWPQDKKKLETTESLAQKPLEWFIQKAKDGQLALHKKLECIRKLFPALVSIEKTNYFKIDLRFTICLIEMLRHIIVHNNGRINDITKFTAETFRRAGISNNGKYDSQKSQLIYNFVTSDEKGYHVTMLEIQVTDTPFHIDRLNNLLNYMLAYAHYIYHSLIRPTYFCQHKLEPTIP